MTRISAANRSKLGQWWVDNKRIAKPVAIATAVIIAIIWLVLELVRIANT